MFVCQEQKRHFVRPTGTFFTFCSSERNFQQNGLYRQKAAPFPPAHSLRQAVMQTALPKWNKSQVQLDFCSIFALLTLPCIIDEVQRVPNLLSRIQVIVDEKKQNAIFILTGSFQQELKQAVSQSLAGRTALLNLLPFSIQEIRSASLDFTNISATARALK
ncbi:MAG: AAA family ATPase [Treponema sp.]|nr:AAA family ATPase [Treponema sp.]